MIALVCKNCGSSDLENGQYSWSFVCKGCGSTLELWEVGYTKKVVINQEDEQKLSKLGATLQV